MKSVVFFILILYLACISTVTTQEIMERKQGECFRNICCRKENEKLKKENEELQKKIQELKDEIKQMYGNCGSSTTMATTQHCQDFGLDWEPFLSSCYYVGTSDLTWFDATKRCELMGSTLAIITTKEENDFVTSLAKRKGLSNSGGYWLDGTDKPTEGSWIWNTTGMSITFQNWGENEPNNENSNEDCLEIQIPKDYKWNDENCATQRQHICEKPLI